MIEPVYELFAVRYASRPGHRSENFFGGDPHDGPMPLDYFVWLAVSAERSVLIDTGFKVNPATPRKDIEYFRTPVEGLALLGIRAEDIHDVIITHMHYDHAGGCGDFVNARFHVQEDEMCYATGKHMCFPQLNKSYPVDDVLQMVRLVFSGRVCFHKHQGHPVPGIAVHHIGGHTPGMQCVAVNTKRGRVVLGSDVSHFYENVETNRPFRSVFNVGDTLLGFDKVRELAGSLDRFVPGHDPLVMSRYPAFKGAQGAIVRLDEAPYQP